MSKYNDEPEEDYNDEEVDNYSNAGGDNTPLREDIKYARGKIRDLRNKGNEKINKIIDNGSKTVNQAKYVLKKSKVGKTFIAANNKVKKLSEFRDKLSESAKNTKAGKAITAANHKVNQVRDNVVGAVKNTPVGKAAISANNTINSVKQKAVQGVGNAASKAAAKVGLKGAAKAISAAIPYVNVAAAALEAANAIKKVATKIKMKITGKTEEELKAQKKKRRRIILICVAVLLTINLSGCTMFIMSETVATDVAALIERREVRYGQDSNITRTNSSGETEHYKPLILFSSDEYNEVIYKDYDNDSCYKTMLKEEYSGDLNGLLLSNMKFLNAEDDTEENRYEVSARNAKKYLQAEKSNFNKIKWRRYTNEDAYGYNSSSTFSSQEELEELDNGVELLSEASVKEDVKTEKVLDSELKVPNLDTYDVLPGATDEEKAMLYINMLSPYMQKWIIPWSILVDTAGDKYFVNQVMNDMYHLAEVNLYELNQENKTTKTYYYLEVEQTYTWDIVEDIYITPGEVLETRTVSSGSHTLEEVTNSKVHKPNTSEDKESSDVSEWAELPTLYIDDSLRTHFYRIDNVKVNYTLKEGPVIAMENGEPIIQKIEIERQIVPYKYVPKLTYLEDFYNIYTANYNIIPINESNPPDYSSGGELANVSLQNESDGIGLVTLEENWKENFSTQNSNVETYKVSYYDEEGYEKLGRRISRIEWKQDWGNIVNVEGGVIDEELYNIYLGDGSYESSGEDIDALLEWILPLAYSLQEESGLLPSITIAQKIQESGYSWDDSEMERVAHNYWGMKAGDSWTGEVFYADTWEVDKNGNKYDVENEAWRAYDTDEEAFSGRGQWFWTNSRDRNVLLACFDGDWEAAVEDFRTNGYATDPTYADKLYDIITRHELYQYDDDVTYDGTIPEYATYDPVTGETINGGEAVTSSGVGATIMYEDVQYETNPYYSELKNNPIYPAKDAEDLIKAYKYYSNGKGYSYDDLYFAFYQIDKYYPEDYFSAGSIYVNNDLKIPTGGFGWPVAVNDKTKVINALYGYTPVYEGTHDGIDIATEYVYTEGSLSKGSKVLATYDGTVTYASQNPTSDSDAYTYVEITTSDGNFITQYGHLSEIYVQVGDRVSKGDEIGRMGTTGNSTGVHLHYVLIDISDGSRVRLDPLEYYNTTPTYGSINRNSITKLPSGYVFESSKLPTPTNVDTGNTPQGVEATLQDVMQYWPSDMEEGRVRVIQKAVSLIGQGCHYSQEQRQPGSANPSYLDCSAYVTWAFTQSGYTDISITAYTGTYLSSQSFYEISESDLKPGDIGLNNRATSGGNANHVGIFIGKNSNGQYVWAHCTSSGIDGPQLKYTTANFTVFFRYKNW